MRGVCIPYHVYSNISGNEVWMFCRRPLLDPPLGRTSSGEPQHFRFSSLSNGSQYGSRWYPLWPHSFWTFTVWVERKRRIEAHTHKVWRTVSPHSAGSWGTAPRRLPASGDRSPVGRWSCWWSGPWTRWCGHDSPPTCRHTAKEDGAWIWIWIRIWMISFR